MSEAIGTWEFAEKYGVTQVTVSEWCREGKISNCNQDGKGSPWHIPKDEFHQLDISKGKSDIGKEQSYQLDQGDCVFIDCRKAYSHSTSNNLWLLQWCHFYTSSLPVVYEKYKERGGRSESKLLVVRPHKAKMYKSFINVR